MFFKSLVAGNPLSVVPLVPLVHAVQLRVVSVLARAALSVNDASPPLDVALLGLR